MKYVLMFGALFLACLGHGFRNLRWELFISVYEKPNRRNLLQALSVGFLLNYFLPYKLGDIFRGCFSGRKMKNGIALGLSTVIVDRYLDIVSVGIIFAGLTIGTRNTEIGNMALFYIVLSVVFMVALFVFNFFCGYIKRIIKAFAGIFNDRIEGAILTFSWALIQNFKDAFHKINKKKLFCYTVAMWSLYMMSYAAFAALLRSLNAQTTFSDIFILLFSKNGIKESTAFLSYLLLGTTAISQFVMAYYMIIPLATLFFLSFFEKDEESNDEEDYINLLPHLNARERLSFLERYFSDVNRSYVNNYLKINQDVSIIRDYSSGSNATTMLCTNGESIFFRKYAFESEGEKLFAQIEWLRANEALLPLPQIMKWERKDNYCYYDMPYHNNSVGLFEYIHTMPIESSWNMLVRILNKLEDTIYKADVRNADVETVERYIDNKILKNLEAMRNSRRIRSLQQYETVIINGIEYSNVGGYDNFFRKDYLLNVFENDNYSIIHGDLTIENIICTRGFTEDDFYLIDPNTGNIHDSSNLDYGKLLQSIHGGYEFLMSVNDVKVNDNRIDFLFTKSSIYSELHRRLEEYMLESFGYKRTRSIYFHEIVNWLRLMPYKIARDEKKALIFYAGLLMIMKDIAEKYGKE